MFTCAYKCRHLPKCFDNIHNLEFTQSLSGSTNLAAGMYSGEGEFVSFTVPCLCDGAVEVRSDSRVVLL